MRDFLNAIKNSRCHSSLRGLPGQLARRRGWPSLFRVRTILRGAACGKGDRPGMLASYQVLDRLPEDIRTDLIRQAGSSRKRAWWQP
jgi:hypothetical protein